MAERYVRLKDLVATAKAKGLTAQYVRRLIQSGVLAGKTLGRGARRGKWYRDEVPELSRRGELYALAVSRNVPALVVRGWIECGVLVPVARGKRKCWFSTQTANELLDVWLKE